MDPNFEGVQDRQNSEAYTSITANTKACRLRSWFETSTVGYPTALTRGEV